MDTSIGYTLPFRHNRDKPSNRYSADIEERRMRYPFTEKLPELLKKFADTLSTCHSSTNVQEALTDPKWTQAIQEEMEALVNNKT